MAGQHTFLSSVTPHPLVSEEATWRVDLGQQDRLPESSHLSQFHVTPLTFTVNLPPSSGFIEDVMGLGILSKF